MRPIEQHDRTRNHRQNSGCWFGNYDRIPLLNRFIRRLAGQQPAALSRVSGPWPPTFESHEAALGWMAFRRWSGMNGDLVPAPGFGFLIPADFAPSNFLFR